MGAWINRSYQRGLYHLLVSPDNTATPHNERVFGFQPTKKAVAEEEGESLNLFFETLARCEAQLKGAEPAVRNDFEGPSP